MAFPPKRRSDGTRKAVGGDMSEYCQSDVDYSQDGSLDVFDVQAVEAAVGGTCPDW